MEKLQTEGLFESVLLKPAREGNRELHVVTGYASPSMVTKHLEELRKCTTEDFQIDMLVGMTGVDGLSEYSMRGFRSIPRQAGNSRFNCSFTLPGKSIHSKVYVWSDRSGPTKAWVGSANYTQTGFGLSRNAHAHHEILVEVDPDDAMNYALAMASGTISYTNPDIGEYLDIVEQPLGFKDTPEISGFTNAGFSLEERVILPLVQGTKNRGEIHSRSGLNWGQREGRNPDQAYIPIPAKLRNLEFFPERGIHFQLVTDDGDTFIATVAQEGSKALETPYDNSLLGKYFRRRLGLPNGTFIRTEDLRAFGSDGVEIIKLQDDLYKLDFHPGISGMDVY